MIGRTDYRLVAGFRFRCLPGCGLCCYTTPVVAPQERSRLIHLDPRMPLLELADGWARIGSRPEGGACHFLDAERCTCRAVRPATCREFPLTTHVGHRVQVSVVLTCPGVDLSVLALFGAGESVGTISVDLGPEIETVDREVLHADSTGELRRASQRRRSVERRLRREGLWQSEEEIRLELRGRLDQLVPTELPPEELSDQDEPLESLPLYYDPAFGRVAWRPHPGGVEFFTLREGGGIGQHLGVFVPPTRNPGLDDPARTLLRGYLEYLLERDATIGASYHQLMEGESELPARLVTDDLRQIAGQVIRLGALRRSITSAERGELTAHDVENGIRATDMDILDRPTSGLRL